MRRVSFAARRLAGAWHSFGVLFVPFTTTMTQFWAMLNGGPLLPALWVSGKLYLVTLAINIVVGVGVRAGAGAHQAAGGGV